MMKHLLYGIWGLFLFLFTTSTLVACSDDDPIDEITEIPAPPSDDDGDDNEENNDEGNNNDNNDNSLWSLNEAITAENTPFVVSDDFVLGESEVWERNAFGDMLLIPQSLVEAKLDISYRYAGDTADRTSTINLNTATTTGWKAGTSYNYSITINGLSDISITVSVNPWVEENTSVSWE